MSPKGILLVNLGTPDSPSWNGLRKYLNQFLTDRRVIDLPWLFRNILFKGIVVPIRSKRVAKLYQRLWMKEGSPLKVYGQRIAREVQRELGEGYVVELAMRYQNPSIDSAIKNLFQKRVKEIVVFPMFPQYASATTGSIHEEVMRILSKKELFPSLRFINSYYDHPDIIKLYSAKAMAYELQSYDHFIFSFHGVPKRYLRKENDYCQSNDTCCQIMSSRNQFCYSAQCHHTAHEIIKELELPVSKCTISFQSRFGPEEWMQPYTDKVLEELARSNKKKVLVFSPAFVADCLETTIEIGLEYKEEFLKMGGQKLDLVESLNDDPGWVKTIASIVA